MPADGRSPLGYQTVKGVFDQIGWLIKGGGNDQQGQQSCRKTEVSYASAVAESRHEREFLHQGIANRPFKRVYSLAGYVQVKDATLSEGILTIDLAREVPEAMKPRRIAINKAAEQAKSPARVPSRA